MMIDDVRPLLGRPEGQELEYKFTLPPEGVLAKIIAAFANTSGGWLILGVREADAGVEFVGIPDDAPASAAVDASLLRLSPKPDVRHGPVLHDGKRLYAVGVAPSSTKVFTENGKIFVRRGSGLAIQLGLPRTRPIVQPAGPPPCVAQLLEDLKTSADRTESHATFLQQYRDLAHLVSRSVDVVCPGGPTLASASSHGRALVRLILASLVDTFEQYLTNILIEIHYAKPDTLKSSAPFTAEDILGCSDMTAVVRMIAKRRVGALQKGGTNDFEDYLKKTVKLDLFVGLEQTRARDISSIRNLYTHANGIVDEKFARFAKSTLNVGDEHAISVQDLCEAFAFFLGVVSRIDKDALGKYGLSTQTD